MAPHQGSQVEVEKAIAVDEQRGLAAEEFTHAARASSAAEDLRLVREAHPQSEAGARAHRPLDGVGQVMRVDHDVAHAFPRQPFERPVQEGPVQHRKGRLGQQVGERPHPRAEAGREHHGLHRAKTMSPFPPDAKKSATYDSVR
jgi:hypothetical protein